MERLPQERRLKVFGMLITLNIEIVMSGAKVDFIVGGGQDLRYVVEGLGGRSFGGRKRLY